MEKMCTAVEDGGEWRKTVESGELSSSLKHLRNTTTTKEAPHRDTNVLKNLYVVN